MSKLRGFEDTWRRDLKCIFPDWENASSKRSPTSDLTVGERITGTVVAVAEFGVWLDIGVGRPALLLVSNMDTPTPLKIEQYPKKGTVHSLWVYRVSELAISLSVFALTPQIENSRNGQ